MIKKFYQNRIAMMFSAPMTLAAFAVFLVAFAMNSSKGKPWMRIVLIILGIVLAVLMFFYYKNKISTSLALKKIRNIDEYLQGGAVDTSFILEERMLAGKGFQVSEKKTEGITSMNVYEKGRKTIVALDGSEGPFEITAMGKEEAQRLCAFLKRKNPDMTSNIEPKGNGTLEELGAGAEIRTS